MTKKTRRRYSDEFKAEAVNMVRAEGYAIAEAARRLESIAACWTAGVASNVTVRMA